MGGQRELLGGDRDHGRGVTQWRGAAVLREMGAHGSSFRALGRNVHFGAGSITHTTGKHRSLAKSHVLHLPAQ